MSRLYYTPPTQDIFDEVKEKSIEIWQTYDNTYGYVDEKINQIKDIKNIGDNFMFMVAMFDHINQQTLSNKLSPESREAIALRIKDGGMPDIYNQFI